MPRMPDLTPEQRGLQIAMRLHRFANPKTWRAEVDAIQDPDVRAAAEAYLKGIAHRMRVVRAAKADGR